LLYTPTFAGSVAAAGSSKRGKSGKPAASDRGGGRGNKGRLTEAEEDEQLLKSAQSKRRVIRLDKQPECLAPICKMHPYQLEGLNWLIKLHDNGINGVLADEMCVPLRFNVLIVEYVALPRLNQL
jgi:SWI/SNF-related matrix-associated actin-dependent regulator of chromatin subfamily A member 5